jgi:hypothetical protein
MIEKEKAKKEVAGRPDRLDRWQARSVSEAIYAPV